jgi:hypothetical protein
VKRSWVLNYYACRTRILAVEMIDGGPKPRVADVIDGPAWLVLLLVAPLTRSATAPHGAAALGKRP